MFPEQYSPWQSVYYFYKWSRIGLHSLLHDALVKLIRVRSGKNEEPSAGIVNSQTVKTSNICQDVIGYDGGKKIKGRKRHIVVDALGLLLSVIIHSANVHDSVGVTEVL